MQFEKIRTINKRKVIIGGLIGLGIIGVATILPSKAKYRTTDSFNIVNGTINYRVPDFNIVAMYSSEDGSNYTELTERMPGNGYTINESKSYCNLNGSKDTSVRLYTNSEKEHVISNLTEGDKCYLYFDKDEITAEDVLGNLGIENPKEPTSNMFASVATTDEGVFKADDPVYGGTSYYYRGAVTNNYVKFGGFCWRIIRINGDGTIRMIYDGTTCHANGTNTTESLAITGQAYNLNADKSYYVGYTYDEGLQRPYDNATATESNLKAQTELWYKTNISDKGYDSKVADGKFCNDRDAANGYTWVTEPSSTFYYAGYDRSGIKNSSIILPTLSCNKADIYKLKIGSITMDEIIFAGGKWITKNNNYYLYNGNNYRTITPHNCLVGTSSRFAGMFTLDSEGKLYGNLGSDTVTNNRIGIRPVINLRADTVFSSGDGTIDSPYTVQ